MVKKRKRKTFAWQPKNQFIYKLMSSPLGVIIINWVFQGILGMDSSERIFKVGLDIALTILFTFVLSSILNLWLAIVIGFIIAHTVNWVFNGHLFVIGRFVGFTKTPPRKIWDYMKGIKDRAQHKPFLAGVAVFGAVTRGEGIRETSDVDIRFIKERGFWNALLANWYSMYERTRAVFHRFPLDLYLYDGLDSLNRLRKDEQPIILYDPKGLLQEKYKERGFRLLS